MGFDRKPDTSMYFITDSTFCGEEEFLCRVEDALSVDAAVRILTR